MYSSILPNIRYYMDYIGTQRNIFFFYIKQETSFFGGVGLRKFTLYGTVRIPSEKDLKKKKQQHDVEADWIFRVAAP